MGIRSEDVADPSEPSQKRHHRRSVEPRKMSAAVRRVPAPGMATMSGPVKRQMPLEWQVQMNRASEKRKNAEREADQEAQQIKIRPRHDTPRSTARTTAFGADRIREAEILNSQANLLAGDGRCPTAAPDATPPPDDPVNRVCAESSRARGRLCANRRTARFRAAPGASPGPPGTGRRRRRARNRSWHPRRGDRIAKSWCSPRGRPRESRGRRGRSAPANREWYG